LNKPEITPTRFSTTSATAPLAAHQDRVINGVRITRYGMHGGTLHWRLNAMPDAASARAAA